MNRLYPEEMFRCTLVHIAWQLCSYLGVHKEEESDDDSEDEEDSDEEEEEGTS